MENVFIYRQIAALFLFLVFMSWIIHGKYANKFFYLNLPLAIICWPAIIIDSLLMIKDEGVPKYRILSPPIFCLIFIAFTSYKLPSNYIISGIGDFLAILFHFILLLFCLVIWSIISVILIGLFENNDFNILGKKTKEKKDHDKSY
jgi:hypothetical protein